MKKNTPRHVKSQSQANILIPKPKKKVPDSDPPIQEILLQKDSKSKSKLAEQRLKAKAEQLREIKESPSQQSHRRVQSQEPIFFKHLSQATPKPSPPRQRLKKKTKQEPKPIPAPSHFTLIETLKNLPPNKPETSPKFSEMSLIEKTSFTVKQQKEILKKAEQLKIQKDLENCTFRPNLKKPKAASALASPRSAKSIKKNVSEKPRDDLIRIPPPVLKISSSNYLVNQGTVLLSSHYSQFSPLVGQFGFKEGADFETLKNRSQNMLTYNAYTNRE